MDDGEYELSGGFARQRQLGGLNHEHRTAPGAERLPGSWIPHRRHSPDSPLKTFSDLPPPRWCSPERKRQVLHSIARFIGFASAF